MTGPDRLLLTRPLPQARRFAAEAAELLGVPLDTVIAPLQRIETTGSLPDMAGVGGLILSSENGAASYAALGGRPGLRAWCVGARTRAAAAKAGLDAVLAAPDADALVAYLTRPPPTATLLHLHGERTAGRIAERLAEAGLSVRAATIYTQRAQPLPPEGRAALAVPGPILVPVFSPRSADLVMPWLAKARATPLLAAISPAAARALALQTGWKLAVAETPDAAGLLAALSRLRAGESS